LDPQHQQPPHDALLFNQPDATVQIAALRDKTRKGKNW
jgi:hypothetical protein